MLNEAQPLEVHAVRISNYRPLASAHPLIIRILDWLYHRIAWFWTAIVLGSVIYGAIGALLVGGPAAVGNPSSWASVAWIIDHPTLSVGIGAGLLALTVFGLFAHPHAHGKASVLLPLVRASAIQLDDPAFKQGQHPLGAYFERSAFKEMCVALHDAIQRGEGGVALFGLPMVGKTRMALEAIRREARGFTVLVWPRMPLPLDAVASLGGQRIILLLDDLHELARKDQSGPVMAAIRVLQHERARLVVVATCRDGMDRDDAEREFGALLLDRLTHVTLPLMSKGGAEWHDFLAFVEREASLLSLQKPTAWDDSGDGTPGSILLNLEPRTRQLRDLPYPEKAALKALSLLRAAQVFSYPVSRVRRVATMVFESPDGLWAEAVERLVRDGWVRLGRSNPQGEDALVLPSDAYLDVCLPNAEVYPLPNLKIQDDFPQLAKACMTPPVDAFVLFRLGDTLRGNPGVDAASQLDVALQYCLSALHAIEGSPDRELWADGQATLAAIYMDRVLGDPAENGEQAIPALHACLAVYTRDAYPVQWALIQDRLGNAYVRRIRGDRRENIERALQCYYAAVEVLSRTSRSEGWALTQSNLGMALLARGHGQRADMVEQAIAAFYASLETFTREAFPRDWARTLTRLGMAYLDRLKGNRAANVEESITLLESALQVLTIDQYPHDWAATMNTLGKAYLMRESGDHTEQVEHAIYAESECLRVWTRDAYPVDWARAISDLGEAWRRRESGSQRDNLERALEHFRAALTVLLPDAFPEEHRNIRLNLAEALVTLGHWRAAADEYLSAALIEDALLGRVGSIEQRDEILRDGQEAWIRLAYCLGRVGKVQDAAIAVERGRARTLADARRMDEASATLITSIDDETLRTEYFAARERLHVARAALNLPTEEASPVQPESIRRAQALSRIDVYHQAQRSFDDVVARIRATIPTFLHSDVTSDILVHAARACSPGHAIVFLLATPWGGMAIGVVDRDNDASGQDVFSTVDLPGLTSGRLDQLASLLAGARKQAINAVHPGAHTDLRECLAQLAEIAMRPVALYLHEGMITAATFIPCGALSDLPILSAPYYHADEVEHWTTIGDILDASVAPSARSLLLARQSTVPRQGFVCIGNPLSRRAPQLPFAEAEARSLALIANRSHVPTTLLIGAKATRAAVIEALQRERAHIISFSGHSIFDADDPMRSGLLLAHDERLTLREILENVVRIHGPRLVLLLSNSTAAVGTGSALDEARSLSAGFIQIGAEAVLGTLWAVADSVSYVLVLRFAQEWLPLVHQEPPATAMARAQHWMRTVTRSQLASWFASLAEPHLETEAVLGDWFSEKDPQSRPFTDPVYWAGFQIVGW